MTTTVPSRSEAAAAVAQRQEDYLEKLRQTFVKLSQQWDGASKMTLHIGSINNDAVSNGDMDKVAPVFAQELRDQQWIVEQHDLNEGRGYGYANFTWRIIYIS